MADSATGLDKEALDEIEDLTTEDLESLKQQFDPENELLPASDRAPNQTEKEPTGPYDRQHLLEHMKDEAVKSEVGKNWLPFEKKTLGKVWKPKPKKETDDKNILPNELTDVLENASEAELMELAAVLGLHGMLNQQQSEQADADKMWKSLKGSGLKKYKPGVVKSTRYKKYTDINAVNELDLENAMSQFSSNDPDLVELNLNNHKDVTEKVLHEVAQGLKTNTNLKRLFLANCRMRDPAAKEIAEAMISNTTIEELNMESNFLTKDGITDLLKMLQSNTTLKEFKLANQAQTSGYQLELEIAKTLEKNHTLLRFGFSFETRQARHLANKHIMRNNEQARETRKRAKTRMEIFV
ncbi:tropomodulin-2-like isoform X2 [Rhopilema esculentum]|uniref:tropomodulin-2-like isoform X2 n=1 Tax=Rhopilema esculentum TaxID=499914 RepID=UPI0031D4453D